MTTQLQRLDEEVASKINVFSTNARALKVQAIISTIGAQATDPVGLFGELIEHGLTDVQWSQLDKLAQLKHPSSAVTRECVRQVVIFTSKTEPKTWFSKIQGLFVG